MNNWKYVNVSSEKVFKLCEHHFISKAFYVLIFFPHFISSFYFLISKASSFFMWASFYFLHFSYYNDLPDDVTCDIAIYADDTTLF